LPVLKLGRAMLTRPWILLTLVLVSPLFAAESPELSAAIELYHKKDYNAAAAALHAVEQKTPNDPELLFYLGKTARRQDHFEDAVKYLEQATQADPKNVEYFIALGDAYGAIANKSRSFAAAQRSCIALETAVGLDPKSEEARAALIDFCRKAPNIVGGGMTKAYAQARELQLLNPVAGTRLLVALLEGEKKYDEAYDACAETLRHHPDDYSLLYIIGRLAAVTGTHMEEGIVSLEKCLSLPVPEKFPSHAAAHVRLGQLYAQEADVVNARKHFEAAAKEDPENKEAKAGLAALSPKKA
jgi:tetratricopeptide (TPR) repeat protein